ncbi:hypothetical protein HQ571_04465 [Candidatus Kuenenbacteria bacterium]|nr:hypothetical protein [Candidatus Kuenenbacteria bacterium]
MDLLAHCGQAHFSFETWGLITLSVLFLFLGVLIVINRRRVNLDMNQVSGHVCNCNMGEERDNNGEEK